MLFSIYIYLYMMPFLCSWFVMKWTGGTYEKISIYTTNSLSLTVNVLSYYSAKMDYREYYFACILNFLKFCLLNRQVLKCYRNLYIYFSTFRNKYIARPCDSVLFITLCSLVLCRHVLALYTVSA